jgi:hypothetical protein
MGRRRRGDQRLRVADVGEVRKDPQRFDEPASLRARAIEVEAEYGTATLRQEPLRQRVIRVPRELRIADRPDQRVRLPH